MMIDNVLKEWKSKKRRMGCVNATEWFCSKVPGAVPIRLTRWTKNGELFEHVVAEWGGVYIDLAPYSDKPNE